MTTGDAWASGGSARREPGDPESVPPGPSAEAADPGGASVVGESDATHARGEHARADDSELLSEVRGRVQERGGVRPPPEKKQRHPLLRLAKELGIVAVTALILSLIIKTFLFQAFWIPSQSMEDTLLVGDRVVVSKLHPDAFSLQRGDVVVFHDPGGWLRGVPQVERSDLMQAVHDGMVFVGLAPEDNGDYLIKRIIGMPGDRVACKGPGEPITVNGVAVTEPYVREGENPSNDPFEIVVPANRVWVMGDNRGHSHDSRYNDDGTGNLGSVPMDRIVGRAMVIMWPLKQAGTLGSDDAFSQVPEPTAKPTQPVPPRKK